MNQAGIWAISQAQHLIGNRMVNHFNGMFWDAGRFAGNCDGNAAGQACCTNHLKLGHMSGNTFHSCGQFGTWCSSAKRENFNHVSQLLKGITHSLCDYFTPTHNTKKTQVPTF